MRISSAKCHSVATLVAELFVSALRLWSDKPHMGEMRPEKRDKAVVMEPKSVTIAVH